MIRADQGWHFLGNGTSGRDPVSVPTSANHARSTSQAADYQLDKKVTEMSNTGLEAQKIDGAVSLYKECLTYFSALSRSNFTVYDRARRTVMQESLGKLFLWGEDFQDGKLALVLTHSIDLRDSVLRLLVALTSALIKGTL